MTQPPPRHAVDLAGVPQTLLLPLWGRANDARSPRSLLGDTQAADIVARLDLDPARLNDQLSDYSSLYWARRALLIDGVARDFARRNPGGVVVNVGAGLDTTFSRVDDGQIRWFDLDLPEVVATRRTLIPESDRNRHLAGSLLDEGWIDELGPTGPTLLIFGGVLFYFEPAQVVTVLQRLARRRPGAELALDILSPIGAWFTMRYLKRVGMESAPIRWTARTGADVARMVPGTEVVGTMPIFDGTSDPEWSLGLRVRIWMTDRLPIGRMLHLRLPR